MRAIFCAIAAIFAGCATARPQVAASQALETIRFEVTACDGRCPAFVVEARSDGSAWFEGRSNTAVIGRRDFTLTQEQFAEYRRRLESNRPSGERLLDAEHCPEPAAPGFHSVDVRWSGPGRSDRLLLYFGCETVWNADFVDAVLEAPEALGITHWVRGD
jgi:hypothetical protein